MQEKNYQTLQDALQRLPQYEPDIQLWERIEEGVLEAAEQDQLQDAVEALPQYEPPSLVWDNIAEELEKEPKHSTKVVSLRWWKSAAAAIILLVAFWGIGNRGIGNEDTSTASISVTYSEEMVDVKSLQLQDWSDADNDFQIIKQLCAQRSPVCMVPEFKQLRVELKDLDYAKQVIEENTSDFETDPAFQIQLAKIERERSDILKKMIAFI